MSKIKKMEKLELKHLAPYLPFGLNGRYILSDVITLSEYQKDSIKQKDEIRDKKLQAECVTFFLQYCKPILRPLSDLTKEIEINGEKFVPIEWFEIGDGQNNSLEFDHGNIKLIAHLEVLAKQNVTSDIQYLPHFVVNKLFEWHFDVFGLIEKGLAIDINTIK